MAGAFIGAAIAWRERRHGSCVEMHQHLLNSSLETAAANKKGAGHDTVRPMLPAPITLLHADTVKLRHSPARVNCWPVPL